MAAVLLSVICESRRWPFITSHQVFILSTLRFSTHFSKKAVQAKSKSWPFLLSGELTARSETHSAARNFQ